MDKKYIIEVDGEGFEYDKDSNESILSFLESKNVPMKFQCKDGYCGACKCKIEEGEVIESDNAMGYTHEDEILPCASKPKGNIKIRRI